jgi:hypothetical protein
VALISFIIGGFSVLALILLVQTLLAMNGANPADGDALSGNPMALIIVAAWALLLALFALGLSLYVARSVASRGNSLSTTLAALEADSLHGASQGSPAFTRLQADAWLEEMIPVVEDVAGRQFSEPPSLELAEWQEIAAALNADMQLCGIAPEREAGKDPLVDSLFELAAVQSMISVTPYILGKYGVAAKSVFLLPRNVSGVLERTGLEESSIAPIVKLTIAHELLHMLQDQEVDLAATLRRCSDPASLEAFNIVMEGHAMVIQELIGRKIDAQVESAELNRLLLGRQYPSSDSKQPRMSSVYRSGLKLMTRYYQDGGAAKMWDVLVSISDSSVQIEPSESR